mgnify:CR=1 FL=1
METGPRALVPNARILAGDQTRMALAGATGLRSWILLQPAASYGKVPTQKTCAQPRECLLQ